MPASPHGQPWSGEGESLPDPRPLFAVPPIGGNMPATRIPGARPRPRRHPFEIRTTRYEIRIHRPQISQIGQIAPCKLWTCNGLSTTEARRARRTPFEARATGHGSRPFRLAATLLRFYGFTRQRGAPPHLHHGPPPRRQVVGCVPRTDPLERTRKRPQRMLTSNIRADPRCPRIPSMLS
jgi:hypothetical protein